MTYEIERKLLKANAHAHAPAHDAVASDARSSLGAGQ
jgi:hypothetical protein